jgi:hypothetical protein
MTSSSTLEAIESLSFLSLVGRMIKSHSSMLDNLFYNVVKLVLMTDKIENVSFIFV